LAACPLRQRLSLVQRVDDAHDLRRRSVLQRNDFHVLVADLVDAADDADDAVNVVGPIEMIRMWKRVGRKLPVLGDQLPQVAPAVRADILDIDDWVTISWRSS